MQEQKLSFLEGGNRGDSSCHLKGRAVMEIPGSCPVGLLSWALWWNVCDGVYFGSNHLSSLLVSFEQGVLPWKASTRKLFLQPCLPYCGRLILSSIVGLSVAVKKVEFPRDKTVLSFRKVHQRVNGVMHGPWTWHMLYWLGAPIFHTCTFLDLCTFSVRLTWFASCSSLLKHQLLKL